MEEQKQDSESKNLKGSESKNLNVSESKPFINTTESPDSLMSQLDNLINSSNKIEEFEKTTEILILNRNKLLIFLPYLIACAKYADKEKLDELHKIVCNTIVSCTRLYLEHSEGKITTDNFK